MAEIYQLPDNGGNNNGEPAAYLQGHLMKKIVEKVGSPCK